MVRDLVALDMYPWSGHAVLMGNRNLSGQAVDEVLLLFGKRLSSCRKKYRQFVLDGISQGRRPELVGGGLRRSRKASNDQDECANFDDRVLGSGEFIERLRQEANIRPILLPRKSLSDLRTFICELFEVEEESIFRRTRSGPESEARAVFCYTAARLVGMSGTKVGTFLSMGQSAVSRAVYRGERIVQETPSLKEKLERDLH
jgi:hypothetical protein